MNNERRKRINSLIGDLNALADPGGARQDVLAALDAYNALVAAEREKVVAAVDALKAKLEDIASEIESIRDEEQEGFDNLSEGLQQSERGQAMEAAASALDEAHGYIDNLKDLDLPDVDDLEFETDPLDEAVASLETAQE